MYELQHDTDGKLIGVRLNGASIPADEGNRDWQKFLDWNDAQKDPLELSDMAPPEQRVPKLVSELSAEIGALAVEDREKLIVAMVADWLRGGPQRGHDAGVAIDGDHAV